MYPRHPVHREAKRAAAAAAIDVAKRTVTKQQGKGVGSSLGSTPDVPPTAPPDDEFAIELGCEKKWCDMSEAERSAVLRLGWTEASWDAAGSAPFQVRWEELSPELQVSYTYPHARL